MENKFTFEKSKRSITEILYYLYESNTYKWLDHVQRFTELSKLKCVKLRCSNFDF